MKVRSPETRPALPVPALLLALAAAAFLVAPPAPASVPTVTVQGASPVRTVEPTLSLRIDAEFEGMERSGGRGRGRLRIDLEAIDDVRDLEIALRHDEALAIPEEASLFRERLRLRRGERRALLTAVEAKEDRDLPLRLEATFLTSDGTLVRLGTGVTLQKAKLIPEGRIHLGAVEYPALVIGGPQP